MKKTIGYMIITAFILAGIFVHIYNIYWGGWFYVIVMACMLVLILIVALAIKWVNE